MDTLDDIKDDYRHFLTYKNDYITEIEKYSIYFDIMTQMYQILNNNIGRVYNDYTDEGVNTVYYLMYIIYIALCVATNLRYKAAISLLQDEKHIPTTNISIN